MATLSTRIKGEYRDGNALSNVTVAGAPDLPRGMSFRLDANKCSTAEVVMDYSNGVLHLSGLEDLNRGGVWGGGLQASFMVEG